MSYDHILKEKNVYSCSEEGQGQKPAAIQRNKTRQDWSFTLKALMMLKSNVRIKSEKVVQRKEEVELEQELQTSLTVTPPHTNHRMEVSAPDN